MSPVSFQVRGLDIGTDWLRWTWLSTAFSIVTWGIYGLSIVCDQVTKCLLTSMGLF